jgi:hypothetical protein
LTVEETLGDGRVGSISLIDERCVEYREEPKNETKITYCRSMSCCSAKTDKRRTRRKSRKKEGRPDLIVCGALSGPAHQVTTRLLP